jgi:RNA polymerase sigma-70 factor (ECF subfamily)
LQRARATLAERGVPEPGPDALTGEQDTLVARYVDAFERYVMDALATLIHEDATLSMPPYRLWLRGREAIRAWLLGRGAECRGSRLLPTAACGSPAFGQYRPSGPGGRHEPWALAVLEVRDGKVAALNSFLDVGSLFPRFGLPPVLGP